MIALRRSLRRRTGVGSLMVNVRIGARVVAKDVITCRLRIAIILRDLYAFNSTQFSVLINVRSIANDPGTKASNALSTRFVRVHLRLVVYLDGSRNFGTPSFAGLTTYSVDVS